MATKMAVTMVMATVPVVMLLTRSSGAEVNFRLLEDVCLGSRVNSWTILLVSSSVLLVRRVGVAMMHGVVVVVTVSYTISVVHDSGMNKSEVTSGV